MSERRGQEWPRAYGAVRGLFRLLVRVFFRSIEVTGLEHVPKRGGGIVVAWHPNGLVDGALILGFFPRQVVFGARHGLFTWPLLGAALRAIGTVPIYRRQDLRAGGGDERRLANQRSLGRLAEATAGGAFAALFPEGRSHDEPGLVELKSGAARLFYDVSRATPESAPKPLILPVGLHYDKKNLFGSRALIAFHPPMALAEELARPLPAEAPEDQHRKRARVLMTQIETALVEVVHATDSWEVNHVLHRIRKLVRAERAARAGVRLRGSDMAERELAFSRVWEGYRARLGTHAAELDRLLDRVGRYGRVLRALGMDDAELDLAPRLSRGGVAGLLLLQIVLIYLVLPPILLLGYLVNVPVAYGLRRLASSTSELQKGEASIKVLVGAIAFPVVWIVVAVAVALGWLQLGVLLPRLPAAPWIAGVLTFLLCALGGLVVVSYQRMAADAIRALRVRYSRAQRRRTIERMRRERAHLYDQTMALAEGLDLPGRVAEDGRIVHRDSS